MSSLAASRIGHRWGRSQSSSSSPMAINAVVTSSEEGMAFDHAFGYTPRHDAGA